MAENHKNTLLKELKYYKNSWLNELKMTNKSNHTIISYNHTISTFIDYINFKTDLISFLELKKTNIIDYLNYRNNILNKQDNLGIQTKKLLITHLKIFFKYIEENSSELYDFRYLLDIKIKIPKKEPKALTKDDQARLFSTIEQLKLKDDYISVRNVFILKILFTLGLRREEIVNLRVSDFKTDFEEKEHIGYSLKILGKGSKERILYIKLSDIEFELEAFKEVMINDYICTTKYNHKMDGSQVYRMIKAFYKKANIDPRKYDVHSIRHTFATNLILKGYDISVVQTLLGHSDIKTTSIYTRLRQDAIKQIIYNK
jgi:site-specific recombinase XerD